MKKNLNIVAYCSIKNNTIKLNNITRIAKDQKLTFLGTGCLDKWRSNVLTIGKRLLIQLKNPDDSWVIMRCLFLPLLLIYFRQSNVAEPLS